ncbi:uncharacterized protein LOC142979757 isoform X2 [Anticarsia gemmatalis]|uniref:uncharacterized protein LOC142979757 isoform X2 n=1 Tax=Anticarsia gemmatalis TaxID=129554 RepID=UPI003F777CFE
MMLQVISLLSVYIWTVESAVLDPSLYLSPRPPLTDASGSLAPASLWQRSAQIMQNFTEAQDKPNNSELPTEPTERSPKLKRIPEPREKAKLFWPSLRPSHYSVGTGNIQIPLTFSLSGLYGKYSPGTMGTGVIGSTYETVSEIGGTAVSALAGSSYGNYRTYPGLRIYRGENGPAWSGWGNGKWGHYGKG